MQSVLDDVNVAALWALISVQYFMPLRSGAIGTVTASLALLYAGLALAKLMHLLLN